MSAQKARQRTYTTVGHPSMASRNPPSAGTAAANASPNTPTNANASTATPVGSPASPARAPVVRKMGIHPEPQRATAPCSCDRRYLRSKFCHPPAGLALNFHERFTSCASCGERPCDKLCTLCWKGFCANHAADHVRTSPDHHLMLRYELWHYEECFWCYRCGGYCAFEGFDGVLEPLFASKGSFVYVPVTSKHLDAFEDHGIRVGTGTMQGWRADNEDAHVVCLGLPVTGMDYVAVFDGHGGPFVARQAGKRMHEIIDGLFRTPAALKDIPGTLSKAFLLFDEVLSKETTSDESGSTGCTANVILIDHTTHMLFCANAGDARSVLCRGTQAIALSEDHRPSLPQERSRIVAAGSTVSADDRVEGLLAVSRALGDFDFKQASTLPPSRQAVTSLPDVNGRPLTPDDHFIITACDGIWDCLTSQQAVAMVLADLKAGVTSPTQICGRMLDRCVAREIPDDGIGTDNMSVVLTFLR